MVKARAGAGGCPRGLDTAGDEQTGLLFTATTFSKFTYTIPHKMLILS